MIRRLRLDRLLSDRAGASGAEFALILPLLLLLLFGIIDAGRFLWEVNKAEKATQVGARVAVVTKPLPPGLATASYVGVGGLTQGDLIPASALGLITCNNTACTCTTSPCPTLGTFDGTAFNTIFTRMRNMKRDITASNVRITYRGSGLGYAGDPNGMEISPLVTVELTGVQFQPITSFLLASFTLPAFRTTLTAEDSAGSVSN